MEHQCYTPCYSFLETFEQSRQDLNSVHAYKKAKNKTVFFVVPCTADLHGYMQHLCNHVIYTVLRCNSVRVRILVLQQ